MSKSESIDDLASFTEVMESLKKKKRRPHLLLGNGFSMSFDSKIFSYNAMHDFVSQEGDADLKALFDSAMTKDFEVVMRQLVAFIGYAEVLQLGDEVVDRIRDLYSKLKSSLIRAISAMHPEHVFKVPEAKSISCANFLRIFLDQHGQVFSTNYDLLMYWVLMRQEIKTAGDGFGRDLVEEGEAKLGQEPEYSELRWGRHRETQQVHYLHGGLHLFDDGVEIVKEQYDEGSYIMENISRRLEEAQFPVFVTAGSGREKLEHIAHNRYLSHCFDRFCQVEGSLVTFGFAFGDQDSHIFEAINKAAKQGRKSSPRLWSVYVGVYCDQDLGRIPQLKSALKCKVTAYDARTAPVWEEYK